MATPQDALERARDRWNAGDLDGYLELYDEAIRLHGYAPEPLDKPAVRGFYEAIFAAFDPRSLEFHEVLESGDARTVRFTMTGRHVGEFMGLPGTNRQFQIHGVRLFDLADSRIRRERRLYDFTGLLIQVGVLKGKLAV